MGFDEAQRSLIESLKKMNFLHFKERSKIWEKNKLFSGEVSVEFVLDIIENCDYDNYESKLGFSKADDKKLHLFIKNGWYIKYCLRGGIVHFVSVHKEKHHV